MVAGVVAQVAGLSRELSVPLEKERLLRRVPAKGVTNASGEEGETGGDKKKKKKKALVIPKLVKSSARAASW